MLRILYFSLLMIGIGFAKDFSMQEAWNYVLENNDGIKAEELGVQRQEKISLASKLSFLPNIDLTAFYTYNTQPLKLDLSGIKNDILSANPPGNVASIVNQIPNTLDFIKQNIIVGSLNILYPLFTGGKRIYAINIANLQKKDAKEMLRLKQLATFEELVKVYYGVLFQQDILQTLQEIQDGAQAHFENAKQLQQAGQIAKLEVLSAQVAFDKSKNKTKEAKNAFEISKLALDAVLGIQDVNPSSKIIIPKTNLKENQDFFVQRAIDSYPMLKSLDNKILIANEVKKIEISKFFPEVAFMGSYFLHNDFLLTENFLPNWYVGIVARMPLVTPGGTIPKIQASKIAQIQLTKTKTQAIKDMELLVKKTYKEVVFAQQEFWSLDSSVKLAQENLKLQENAFTQGLATSVQVTDARNALASVLIEQKGVAYKYVVYLSKLMAVSDNIAAFYQIQH